MPWACTQLIFAVLTYCCPNPNRRGQTWLYKKAKTIVQKWLPNCAPGLEVVKLPVLLSWRVVSEKNAFCFWQVTSIAVPACSVTQIKECTTQMRLVPAPSYTLRLVLQQSACKTFLNARALWGNVHLLKALLKCSLESQETSKTMRFLWNICSQVVY